MTHRDECSSGRSTDKQAEIEQHVWTTTNASAQAIRRASSPPLPGSDLGQNPLEVGSLQDTGER